MAAGPELALGTVQFGLDYGISNEAGRCSEAQAAEILDAALANGVTLIDTAAGYGNAEEVLGRNLPGDQAVRIVSKVPSLPDVGCHRVADILERSLDESLQKLKRDHLYGLLLHGADDVKRYGPAIWDAMSRFLLDGRVERIGVSIYTVDQIKALPKDHRSLLVQAPVNIFDQRILRSKEVTALAADGVEFHARSLFLQGALLMEPDGLPAHLSGLRQPLNDLLRKVGVDAKNRLAAALGVVRRQADFAAAVVGVVTRAQLEQILEVFSGLAPQLEYEAFALDDEVLLDPRFWPVHVTGN